jgi:outer membrane protein TolC
VCGAGWVGTAFLCLGLAWKALAEDAAPPAEEGIPPGVVRLTVSDAVLAGLRNNQALRVEQFTPDVTRTGEGLAEGVFDPRLGIGGSAGSVETPLNLPPAPGTTNVDVKSLSGEVAVDTTFPTGTRVVVGGTSEELDDSVADSAKASSRVGVAVSQPLLRGAGRAVNRVQLRQAQIETRISEYELRGFTESLVARIETTYWDYGLALHRIQVLDGSLKLAEDQLLDVQERVALGKMAQVELAAAQAERAARREELVLASNLRERLRLQLLNLLSIPGTNRWSIDVALLTEPALPSTDPGPVDQHVRDALQKRPDLKQARLKMDQGDLEIVRTRNGLLPKLDLFVSYGTKGYAASFADSVSELGGDYRDLQAGVLLAYPLGNHESRARHQRSRLTRAQQEESLANLCQLVEVEVRSAYSDLVSASERVAASRATLKLREEVFRGEQEKFRIGASTSLLVAQAQRDLLLSQLSVAQAVAATLKAQVELFRLNGSLLDRYQVTVPRQEP